MPVQPGWVELWLRRYCRPGAHLFVPQRAGLLVCVVCRKEVLEGEKTCLVCGIPGEFPRRLVYAATPQVDLRGRLCGPCLDDFEALGAIAGWAIGT
ncbi:MAG: hypothetical protein IT304_01960 [Dehalococcoidia bacterium]|nr:hypothetical protein [Dehalococcoidia bacterium]